MISKTFFLIITNINTWSGSFQRQNYCLIQWSHIRLSPDDFVTSPNQLRSKLKNSTGVKYPKTAFRLSLLYIQAHACEYFRNLVTFKHIAIQNILIKGSIKPFYQAILGRFARLYKDRFNPTFLHHFDNASDVNFGLLSERIVSGLPRHSSNVSSSLITRYEGKLISIVMKVLQDLDHQLYLTFVMFYHQPKYHA